MVATPLINFTGYVLQVINVLIMVDTYAIYVGQQIMIILVMIPDFASFFFLAFALIIVLRASRTD